jgi:hypothetical protein
MDDKTSEKDCELIEDTDSSSNSEDLWPMFSGNLPVVQDSDTRSHLKSGKKSYQQPIPSSKPSSQKLMPAAIPRQTKHNQQKCKVQALGYNNNIMEKYFI